MSQGNQTDTDILEQPFNQPRSVTVDMQRAAFAQAHLMRGSVRLMMGRLSTSQELGDRRRKVMERNLI